MNGYRFGAVEIESTLKRKVRRVRDGYVEIEFELDNLAVTSGGRFMGEVDRIPGNLRKVRAKIYSDGFVQFDRMIYLVGNEAVGFELVSTRYCGGDVLNASYDCLDPKSGELDFYRERVESAGYSRNLDLAAAGQAVAIALVPDEEYRGFQYSVAPRYSDDGYYSGTYDYSSLSSYDNQGFALRSSNSGAIQRFEVADSGQPFYKMADNDPGFSHDASVSYKARSGETIELQTESDIRYLDD